MSYADVYPGEALKLSEEERTKLGKFLQELGTDLEAQHAPLIKNIDVWWKWVEATPATQRRTDPWDGASNIVVPLIQMHSDAIKARLQNVVFGAPDLWTFRTRNEEFEPIARQVTDFLNWASDDNEFDIFTPSTMWFDEAVPIGSSILMLNWTSRRRQIFTPNSGKTPVSVELGRGPQFTHIPREQVLWQPGRSVTDSEYIFVQSWRSWGDLVSLEMERGIDKGFLDKVKPSNGSSSYSAGIMQHKLRDGGIDIDGSALYDIRQVYIEQPVLRGLKFEQHGEQEVGTPSVPLCVTYDHTSGTVLRVIAKPYYTRGWNFYECNFRSNAGRPNSGGVAKRLEHLQRGVTTMANQAIDAVTFANSVSFITNDRRFMSQKFTPGRPLFADLIGPEAVREVVLPKGITPDIALINMLMAMAERVTGMSDPNLGRETRYGGHPSPASSTAMLLSEGRETAKATVKQIRLQYSRMGEDVATMYQQFESRDTGTIDRSMGTADGAIVKQWMFPTGPIAGNIEFDLRAVTENLNPEAEREQAIFTMQATASYYGQVMQALQVASHPQAPPPVKQAAIRSIEALTAGFTKVLEAAQVDDIKKFVMMIKEANYGADTIGQVGAAVGEQLGGLQQANGGRPLPPYSTGAGGLPVAADGAAIGTGF